MLKAYADEHVPLAIVCGLRIRGMDVTSVTELERQGTDDDVLLEQATHEQRMMLTCDADFCVELRLCIGASRICAIVFLAPARTEHRARNPRGDTSRDDAVVRGCSVASLLCVIVSSLCDRSPKVVWSALCFELRAMNGDALTNRPRTRHLDSNGLNRCLTIWSLMR